MSRPEIILLHQLALPQARQPLLVPLGDLGDQREAQRQLLSRISALCDYPAVLCGSSIWVDRTFLDRHMPGLAGYLHYRMVDVTSFKLVVDRWLGALAIGLHAEHGMYSRIGGEWRARGAVPEDLREKVLATLERVASNTPGSHVELKAAGLAWHYRLAEREQGAHQARELRLHLRELLVGTPLEVLLGDKVVEVRPRGVHKGLIARELIRPGDLVFCVGDDRTDEDLFAAAPESALTAKVGPGPSAARFRVSGVPAVRAILRAIAQALEEVERDMSEETEPKRAAM